MYGIVLGIDIDYNDSGGVSCLFWNGVISRVGECENLK